MPNKRQNKNVYKARVTLQDDLAPQLTQILLGTYLAKLTFVILIGVINMLLIPQITLIVYVVIMEQELAQKFLVNMLHLMEYVNNPGVT